ncbi:MAG: hypothetical protein PHW96_01865 [Candidatus Nanoarchaeia archaeon]|nr:hypothetical protein [Candidatus Nanoarchaeia archaeon]
MGFEDAVSKAGLTKDKIIDWRQGRLQEGGEDGGFFKGYAFLTKDSFIFVKDKQFLSGARIMFKIPVKKIKSIKKTLGMVYLSGNTADKDSNILKKIFSTKSAFMKLDNADSFITKIKELMAK